MFKANGMVCQLCIQSLKKTLEQDENVKNVDVNFDEKRVVLNFKDKKTLSDEKIQELFKDAGYEGERIKEEKKKK